MICDTNEENSRFMWQSAAEETMDTTPFFVLVLVFFIVTDVDGFYDDLTQPTAPSGEGKTSFDVSVPQCVGGVCQKPYLRYNKKCYCDKECLVFGDCCFDWLMNAIGSNTSIDALRDLNKREQSDTKSDHKRYFVENSVCYKLRNCTAHLYIWAISSCPASNTFTAAWKTLCENAKSQLEDIPVTLKSDSDTQIVFRNKYCSYCYGWKDHDIVHWRTGALCPKTPIHDPSSGISVEEYIALNCFITYFHPLNNKSLRYCTRKTIESENPKPLDPPFKNQSGFTLWTMCNLYITPVSAKFSNNSKFANPHCGVYHLGENVTYNCLKPDKGDGYYAGVDLNLLFNFDWGTKKWSPVMQSLSKCLDAEVLYPETNDCGNLICPPTFTAMEGKCVMNTNAVLNTTDSIPFDAYSSTRYSTKVTITISLMKNTSGDFPELFNRLEDELKRFGIFISFATITKLGDDLNQITYSLVADTNTSSSFDSRYYEFVQMQNEFLLSNISIFIQMDNLPDNNVLNCVESEVVYYDIGTMIVSNNTMYVQPGGDTFLVKLAVSRFNISFNVSSEDKVEVHSIAICKASGISLNCRMRSYTKDMYNVTGNQAFLKGSTSAIQQFEIKYGILYVCQSDNETLSKGFINVLTWVTILISVFSLLLLLILHCIFPSFCDTLHGKNLVSFSASLLVAQVLFLAGSHAEAVLCRVIAVGQHYFWLASFLWTCAMAFDLAKNLNAKTMTLPSNSKGRACFRRYCLTVWGIPAIIIAVCIGIEYSGVNFEIEYGEDQPCWIGNAKSSLIVFGIPVGLCVLFDIMCFAIVLHGMETTKRTTKFARKEEQNYCVMYSKIAILLGITWIFGFMASVTQLKTFFYINVILNGLQGFFVLVAFCFNTRIIQKITKALHSISSTTQDSSVGISKRFDLRNMANMADNTI